jgi:serine/threonine protein kinase
MPRLDQYQIGELLGEGGIGRVHAAYDTHLRRHVALKSLRPGRVGDPGFVERFRAEATNLAHLNHPNITTIYDLLEQGRSLYIVMERVQGPTLEQLLRQHRGGLGIAKSLTIIGQVADGLAYAHRQGVIHRDIKPANVMITPSGLVKIMDFGIARLRDTQRVTRDGQIVGTLAYMAPEQLRGEPADERSDLYSLAMMLHEMLTGSPPFTAATEYELIQAQMNAKPQRLREVLPSADPRIEAALLRALAKKPAQRFASVVEFKNALGANASGTEARSPLRDTATGRINLAGIPGRFASTLASAAMRAGLERVPAGRRVPVMAGVTALLAGLIVWGVLTLNQSSATVGADGNAGRAGGATMASPAGTVIPPTPANDTPRMKTPSIIFAEPTLIPGRSR